MRRAGALVPAREEGTWWKEAAAVEAEAEAEAKTEVEMEVEVVEVEKEEEEEEVVVVTHPAGQSPLQLGAFCESTSEVP